MPALNQTQISPRTRVLLAFGAVYIIWGSTYLAIKYAVETIPPFMMMGVRSLVAGSILYLWGRARNGAEISREHWRALFIIGTSFFLIGHGLLAWAQQVVPSGLAALVIASEPLWIVAIESFTIKDSRIGRYGMIGLLLGFAGMTLLVLSTKDLGLPDSNMTGVFAILVGTLSWAGGAVYSRVAVLPRYPRIAAGMELVVGGVLLLVCSTMLGEPQNLDVGAITTRSLAGLAYLIVFGSVITFGAYVWLLTFTSATRVSTHTYVNPVIAILIGWIAAGENMSFTILAAAILIVASVYIVLKDQRETIPAAPD